MESRFDNRTGQEWLDSVYSYCIWRAERGRHGRLTQAQRNDPERWCYFQGAAEISQVMYAEDEAGISPALPVLNPTPPVDPRIADFCGYPVKELVALLMEADAALTDRRLLSHLQKSKLARMLCERMDANQRLHCLAVTA